MKETVPDELLMISYPLVGTSSLASVEPVLKVTHPAPPALSLSQYPIALFPEFVARLSSISLTTSPVTGIPIRVH